MENDRMETFTRLFAYGPLKRGTIVHDQLCRGVIDVEPARVWGRLFEMSSGYPALQVSRDGIFWRATDMPEIDQCEFLEQQPSIEDPRKRGLWRPVYGHLITFEDYAEALPPLDEWEDAAPGNASTYHRVLLTVEPEDAAPLVAWTYIVPRLPVGSREIVTSEWRLPLGISSGL